MNVFLLFSEYNNVVVLFLKLDDGYSFSEGSLGQPRIKFSKPIILGH